MRQKVSIDISKRIHFALDSLLIASQYATDTDSNRWDFAVSIHSLLELGVNETDFRWFVKRGYLEHGKEITREGDDGREFRPTGSLTFLANTCFVLTDAGVLFAESMVGEEIQNGVQIPKKQLRGLTSKPLIAPKWECEARRLWLADSLIKQFRWPASNQEAVLCAFQEEGWPERIDDPLTPHPDQDSKRRLADTIKCLNRKQVNSLVQFHGDGTGEGVTWELVEQGAA